MPEPFAAHFSEVAHVLVDKIPLNSIHPNYYLYEMISVNFFAYPGTSAEISEIIVSSQKKRSPTNKTPFFLCKTFCIYFSAYISEIFNRSSEEEILPSRLKIPKITSILKTCMRNKVVNYRPISILPLF